MWRQDLRAIYKRHCCSSSSVKLVHPFPEPPLTPSRHSRASMITTFINKPQKQPRASLPEVELESSARMSVEDFASFLAVSEDKESVRTEEAAKIIAKYDTFTNKGDTSHMTLKGFTHYMLSKERSPPPHLGPKVAENMDQPLSDYLIATSHNTYLTGHQLHGESSVNMYKKASTTFNSLAIVSCPEWWPGHTH